MYSKILKNLILVASITGICAPFASAMEPKKLKKGRVFTSLYWAAAGAQSITGLGIYGLISGIIPKEYENDSHHSEIKDQKYLDNIRNAIQECGVSPDTVRIMNGPSSACALRAAGPSYIFLDYKFDEFLLSIIELRENLYQEVSQRGAISSDELTEIKKDIINRKNEIFNTIKFATGHEARHIANKDPLKRALVRMALPIALYGTLRALPISCWNPTTSLAKHWRNNGAKIVLAISAGFINKSIIAFLEVAQERRADLEAGYLLGPEIAKAGANRFANLAKNDEQNLNEHLHYIFIDKHPKHEERARYLNQLAKELEAIELKNKTQGKLQDLKEKLAATSLEKSQEQAQKDQLKKLASKF